MPLESFINLSGSGNIIIVAGAHGVGKSTFCKELLRYLDWPYLTPEEIKEKKGVSKTQALRYLIKEVDECLRNNKSFIIEHSLSGNYIENLLSRVQGNSYKVHFSFHFVESLETLKLRIKKRVDEGGHNIELSKLEKVFTKSEEIFCESCLKHLEDWYIFDNSGELPKLVANKIGQQLTVHIETSFKTFEEFL